MESEILNAQQASDRLHALGMRISPTTLRLGLQQRVFPFGDYIDTGKSPVCYIYAKLLEQWIAARFTNAE